MSMKSRICHEISLLGENEPFFNRDFLNFGYRNAVDIALSRLTKLGVIKRLARGVYVKSVSKKEFTEKEIVYAKTASMNRNINKHGADAAKDHDFPHVTNIRPTFFTTGSTSLIETDKSFIQLIHASGRRVALSEIATGHCINALWWLKKENARVSHVQGILRKFNRLQKEEFLWSHQRMPGWLSDLVHDARGGHISYPLGRRPGPIR